MNNLNTKAEIIGFHNGTVYQSIVSFLTDEGLSETTKLTYDHAVRSFFTFVCKGIDMVNLTEEHLLNIKNEDVKKYRTHLKRQGNSAATINKKLRAVSSLFKELSKDRDQLNPTKVHLKPLPTGKNHYGDFTQDEMNMIIEYVKTKPNGEEKSLLIELACITSFRKNYLLDLRWCDIKKVSDELYEIKGKDDTTKMENEKSIRKEFYERLLTLKKSDDRKDTIFHMHPKTASLMIQELIEELELDPNGERNLAFHSIKNYGINEILKKTNRIDLATQQGNHTAKTMLDKYVRYSKDPSKNPSLMVNNTIDTGLIKEATHEELLKALDMVDDFVKIALMEKLKDIKG